MESIEVEANQAQKRKLQLADHSTLLHSILEINSKILQGVEYKEILEYVFSSITLHIPIDRIGIALTKGIGDDRKMHMTWVKSKVPINYLNSSHSTEVVGARLLEIMQMNKPRINNDITRYDIDNPASETSRLLLLDGIKSNLTCPLYSEGESIGVVFFSSCQKNTYHEFHKASAVQIADAISLIISYGQLQELKALARSDRRNLSMTLHDLKSPLAVINGFAQASMDENWYKNLSSEARKVFQIFFRNSKYMSSLLDDLTEINLLKSVKANVKFEAVDVNEFGQDMFKVGQSIAAKKDVQFNLIISSLPVDIACFDRHRVSRILDNLFSNAVKFSNRNGTIDFIIDAQPNALHFAVRDQGLGIPQAELPKLFKEFGKTSVRPTEGEDSSGQGLAIVKKIVQQCGGEIKVVSEVGVGSTFSFFIPIKNEPCNS